MRNWILGLLVSLVALPVYGQVTITGMTLEDVTITAVAAAGVIAHDASTVNVSSTTTGGCSFTHTPVGTPTLALLWVALDGNEVMQAAPTYGGDDMTLVDSSPVDGGTEQIVFLYELISPSSGAQTVAADFTNDDHHTCIAQTFTGTNLTNPTVETDTYDNSGDPCTAATTTLTLDATTSWMVTAFSGDYGTGTPLPIVETGYTSRGEGETGGSTNAQDDIYGYGDSTGTSGSLSHISTPNDSNNECAQVSVELVP